MPYRAPRYSHLHAAQDVGVAAIDLDGATALAGFPIDNLIDDRQGTVMKLAAAVSGLNIDIDLGANFVTGINRLIIPPNHNIDAITIVDDDNAGFATPATLHALDTGPTPGALIDIDTFDTGASTQQFIRITLGTGSKQYFLPQIFLTKVVTLVVGPNLRRAIDQQSANFARQIQPSGLSPTVQLGPLQRRLEYLYEAPIEGADLTALEALIDAVGMSRPFYLDPASFSATPAIDDPPISAKFEVMPDVIYAVDVASTGVRQKAFALSIIESFD